MSCPAPVPDRTDLTTIDVPRSARATGAACLVGLALALVSGCDEPAKPAGKPGASATATAAPTTAAPPPVAKPRTMPELIVDPEGPYLGGRRVDLAGTGGRDKLAIVVKELPIDGKPVTLVVEKKAKTPYVAAVIAALGDAGAPKVIVKTEGRTELPKELAFTPEKRLSSPPACAVSSMIMKDLSTAVWPFKGGLGKRHSKGFAGPDLSHTAESLKKDLAGCDSTMAFVGADESIVWEMTYNLAGTLSTSDEKKKIDTLVLLAEAPVAGRPVTLQK